MLYPNRLSYTDTGILRVYEDSCRFIETLANEFRYLASLEEVRRMTKTI